MTESLVDQCGADVRDGASRIQQDLEGLGSTSLYFVDLASSRSRDRSAPNPTLGRRLGETIGVAFRGFPTVVGLRRPRRAPPA